MTRSKPRRAETREPEAMLRDVVSLAENCIHFADVGAAYLGEAASYQALIDQRLCTVSAFEPDEREIDGLREYHGKLATIFPYALGDGQVHTLYICPKGVGMNSLLEPDPSTLDFFGPFSEWGRIERTEQIPTRRLDDIDELSPIDFLKMDTQGSELSILINGRTKLAHCVAVETEVSFITLYKKSADVWGH